eukprot:m.72502 g.72502  ORF g.72502 m.72502 type:complete len:735 (+) comp16104_c0_seq1:413-2617(+)
MSSAMLTRVAWETRESVRSREVERSQPAHRRPYTAPSRCSRPASAQSSFTHLGATHGSALGHAASAPALAAGRRQPNSKRSRPKTAAVSLVPSNDSESGSTITPISVSCDSDDESQFDEHDARCLHTADGRTESDTDDTDVENADIEQEETPSLDPDAHKDIPLGVQMYRNSCKKAGCVPARVYERQGNADTVFTMNAYGLGAAGAQALSEGLENNDRITSLALNGNGIRGRGVRHVATMLAGNPYIEHVQLADNALKSDGMHAMAEFFSNGNSRLRSLNLSDNKILDMDLSAFSAAICEDNRLERLELSRNLLGDKAATDIGLTLQSNRTLTHLDLSHNRILHRGTAAMADALRNNDSLQTLQLAHNGIGSEGLIALAGALEGNNSLTSLDVSWNNIHDDGAAALAHVLRTRTTLIEVNLAHNPISEEGTRMLLEALRARGGGLEINLDGLPLSREDSSLLSDIQAQCPDLNILVGSAARDANRLQGLRRRASVVEMQLEERRQSLLEQQALNAMNGADDANAHLHDGSAGGRGSGHNSNGDWRLGDADGHYGGGGRLLRGNTRSGLPPQLSRSAQAQRSDDSDEGIRRSQRMRSSMVITADDLAGFDSDDEEAEQMRDWAERHPDLHDPMLVLEQYVYQNQLRLVEFFFAIDKDRSGGVTLDELQNAVTSLPGLQLNEEQREELMYRLDTNRDGVIKYDELCEGRRIVYEALRTRDPRWQGRDDSDDSDDEE